MTNPRPKKCETEYVDIVARFGSTYRVAYEAPAGPRARDPWLAIIPCKHGHFYVHGGDQLGFATNTRGAIANRLAALPFVTVTQDGDDGVNLVFDVEYFEEIAQIVKPRRRRRLSDEQREMRLRHLEAYRAANPDWRPGQRRDSRQPISSGENPRPELARTETDEPGIAGTVREKNKRDAAMTKLKGTLQHMRQRQLLLEWASETLSRKEAPTDATEKD